VERTVELQKKRKACKVEISFQRNSSVQKMQ